jgi:hypothetical protein
VKSATLHRSDFVQQNVANTKTNTPKIYSSEDKTSYKTIVLTYP